MKKRRHPNSPTHRFLARKETAKHFNEIGVGWEDEPGKIRLVLNPLVDITRLDSTWTLYVRAAEDPEEPESTPDPPAGCTTP